MCVAQSRRCALCLGELGRKQFSTFFSHSMIFFRTPIGENILQGGANKQHENWIKSSDLDVITIFVLKRQKKRERERENRPRHSPTHPQLLRTRLDIFQGKTDRNEKTTLNGLDAHFCFLLLQIRLSCVIKREDRIVQWLHLFLENN